MKNKKGQRAMEFLETYGWAILAAIIAIGVLAYFGVFTSGQYVVEKEYFVSYAYFIDGGYGFGNGFIDINITGDISENELINGLTAYLQNDKDFDQVIILTYKEVK